MLSFKPIIDLRKGEKKGGNKGNNIKKTGQLYSQVGTFDTPIS